MPRVTRVANEFDASAVRDQTDAVRDRVDADVVVVGAGIAGLAVATDLARAGMRTVVLEAAPVAGGCVRIHEVGGVRVDRGADAFAVALPAVRRLAEDLGLTLATPARAGAWVQFGGSVGRASRAAPLPRGTLLGVPTAVSAPDVRRIIGLAGVLRARLGVLLPAAIVRRPLGFGALVRRRMGRRVLDRLVAPVVAGVYSTDPKDLDIDAVAPALGAKLAAGLSLSDAVAELRRDAPPAGSAVAGLEGGMGTLAETLVRALGEAGGQLRLSSPVRSVHSRGGAWTVDFAVPDNPAPTRIVARHVVIATDPAAAAGLVTGATRGRLTLPTAPAAHVTIVTLVVDEPRLDGAPRGTGVLVSPRVPDVGAKALTHLTAKWPYLAVQVPPGRHVLRLSYGRGPGPAGGSSARDSDFVPTALRDAATLLGVPLRQDQLHASSVVHYRNQLVARTVGHAAAIEQFRSDLALFDGLSVAGAAIAGTGLAGIVTDATRLALALRVQWRSTMGS